MEELDSQEEIMFGAPFAIAISRVTRPNPVDCGDANDLRDADRRAVRRRQRYVRPLS